MEEDSARNAVRRLIQELRDDPAQQAMMTRVAERHACVRAKYAGVDVVTLNDLEWQEWLSVHNVFERDKAKGRRQNHRHRLKVDRRARLSPSD